jgi:hypothetical protein
MFLSDGCSDRNVRLLLKFEVNQISDLIPQFTGINNKQKYIEQNSLETQTDHVTIITNLQNRDIRNLRVLVIINLLENYLDKLRVAQLLKEFHAFSETQRFITMFTYVHRHAL